MQNAAAAALKAAQEEHDALEVQSSSKEVPLASLSLCDLDKRRANAAAALEAWENRALKRAASVLRETEDAVEAITTAQEALTAQKALLVQLQSDHARAWEAANVRLKEEKLEKIQELRNICRTKEPLGTNTDAGQSQAAVLTLRQQVQALQQQMELQARQFQDAMRTAQEQHTAAILKATAQAQAACTVSAPTGHTAGTGSEAIAASPITSQEEELAGRGRSRSRERREREREKLNQSRDQKTTA